MEDERNIWLVATFPCGFRNEVGRVQ